MACGKTVTVMSMKVSKGFFFGKKKQKTSVRRGIDRETGTDQTRKVFFASFLFTKKKTLRFPVQHRVVVRCRGHRSCTLA